MGGEEIADKVAKPLLTFIFDAIPVVVKLCRKVYAVYKQLPIVYVQLIIGTVLCFFGGMYPTVFAALQVSGTCCFSFVGTSYALTYASISFRQQSTEDYEQCVKTSRYFPTRY